MGPADKQPAPFCNPNEDHTLDLCTCVITHGGDSRLEFHVPARSPKTYAEVVLLRVIHDGTENVRDVQVIGQQEINPMAEKQRLAHIYGPTVEKVFPGIAPALPESASQDPYPAHPLYLEAGKPAKRGKSRTQDTPSPEGDETVGSFPG